ncbi:MAG: prepilin peptidase [Acidimicrobiaceae bacterium]|nr:prepilin peptidase [Acidimicrobiaceae bacterium]
MNAANLVLALVGGLAAGRLAAVVAGRFAPPSGVRRPIGLIEVSAAVLLAAVVARFGLGWSAVPPLVAAVSLLTLSIVDLRCARLPDAIVFPASAASLAAVVAASIASARPGAIVAAVAAGLGYGAVLWAAHEMRPGGLGFGDVKLAPLLGLHLGWAAYSSHPEWWAVVSLTVQALLLSCLIGLAMGLAQAVLRRRRPEPRPGPGCERASPPSPGLLQTVFPFGPALAAGTMISVLFPEALIL